MEKEVSEGTKGDGTEESRDFVEKWLKKRAGEGWKERKGERGGCESCTTRFLVLNRKGLF